MRKQLRISTVFCLSLALILLFGIYHPAGGSQVINSVTPPDSAVLMSDNRLVDQDTGQRVLLENEIPSRTISIETSDSFSDGLVLHLPMDEDSGSTVYDQSIYGNHGSIFGTTWIEGIKGWALEFNGDDYVLVPNHASLNPTYQITIMAWIKADDWNGNYRILQKGDNDNQYAFTAKKEDDQSILELWLDGVSGGVISVPVPSCGIWHHTAGTYNGSHVTIYIDGTAVKTQPASGILQQTSDNLHIGTKHPGAPEFDFFRGIIDDVRVYNLSLNATGISAYYDEITRDPSLLLDLPMDEGSGFEVYDQSGYGNNGTIYDGATWVPGISGNALEFNGLGSHVKIDPPPDLSSGQLTVSAWVYYNHEPTSSYFEDAIICQDDDSTRIFQLSTYQGKFCWHRMGYAPNALSKGSIEIHTWYHVAVTFDGYTHRLYVDGIFNDDVVDPMSSSTTLPINLGRKNSGEFPFNGIIDEVKIYNRTLSEKEIREMYSKLSGVMYDRMIDDWREGWNGEYYDNLAVSLAFDITIPGSYQFDLEIEYDGKNLRSGQEHDLQCGHHELEFAYEASDIMNVLGFHGGSFRLQRLMVDKQKGSTWLPVLDIYDLGLTKAYSSSDFESGEVTYTFGVNLDDRFELNIDAFSGNSGGEDMLKELLLRGAYIDQPIDFTGSLFVEYMIIDIFDTEVLADASIGQYSWVVKIFSDDFGYGVLPLLLPTDLVSEIDMFVPPGVEYGLVELSDTFEVTFGFNGTDIQIAYFKDTGILQGLLIHDLAQEMEGFGYVEINELVLYGDYKYDDGGNGNGITFTSPGFELLLVLVALPILVRVRKKR